MKRDWICIIGAIIGLLTGIGRGIGGVSLLQCSAAELAVGIGLIAVALWLVVAAGALIMNQDLRNRKWLTVGIILFWIDGIVNGFVLFGSPQLSGQIINLVIVAVVLSCLWLRRNAAGHR